MSAAALLWSFPFRASSKRVVRQAFDWRRNDAQGTSSSRAASYVPKSGAVLAVGMERLVGMEEINCVVMFSLQHGSFQGIKVSAFSLSRNRLNEG